MMDAGQIKVQMLRVVGRGNGGRAMISARGGGESDAILGVWLCYLCRLILRLI